MNRGTDRARVFFCDDDRVDFGRLLGEIYERYEVPTLAYCLMDNHYHLLLRPPDGALSPALQHLSGQYTRRLNIRHGRDGPLFRGRFHSIPVETDTYLMWVSRYIHRNPLSIAGVSSPSEYRWSSYRAYLGRRTCPVWLDPGPVMECFRGRAADYAEFTELVAGAPVGASLAEVVQLAVAVDDLTHGTTDRTTKPQGLAKTVTALLDEHDVPAPWRDELAASLPDRSSGARQSARSRARRRRSIDPAVDRVMAVTRDFLGLPSEVSGDLSGLV